MNNQIFVCISKDGYARRFKPQNRAEKQQMYIDYLFVIQTGFYCRDVIKVNLADNSTREIDPNKLRINSKPVFLTKNNIRTISLEPK